MNEVYLTIPKEIYKESYLNFIEECAEDIRKNGFEFCIPILNNDNFKDGIKKLIDMSKGRNLPKGWVPATVYWLIENGNEIKGIVLVRHRLNDNLIFRGGHITYYIKLSERKKGYATRMLALSLEECKKINIEKVLITCLKKNIGSVKTIKANGGILDSEDFMNGEKFQRYYIQLEK